MLVNDERLANVYIVKEILQWRHLHEKNTKSDVAQ